MFQIENHNWLTEKTIHKELPEDLSKLKSNRSSSKEEEINRIQGNREIRIGGK